MSTLIKNGEKTDVEKYFAKLYNIHNARQQKSRPKSKTKVSAKIRKNFMRCGLITGSSLCG